MFDRSDLLWRDDDPTPATKPTRDDHAKDDQARQVTERPGVPERARQDARDRQDEAARTHASEARANDRRPTRADRGPPGAGRPPHEARPADTHHRPSAGTRRPHARPRGAHRSRRSRTERTRDAVADVGLYRAVSYTDLSDQHFDGHPYATRRSVNHMIRAGLIEEHEATGPEGHTFKVLTATERGARRRPARGGRRRPRPRAADVERHREARRAVA